MRTPRVGAPRRALLGGPCLCSPTPGDVRAAFQEGPQQSPSVSPGIKMNSYEVLPQALDRKTLLQCEYSKRGPAGERGGREGPLGCLDCPPTPRTQAPRVTLLVACLRLAHCRLGPSGLGRDFLQSWFFCGSLTLCVMTSPSWRLPTSWDSAKSPGIGSVHFSLRCKRFAHLMSL